MAEQYVNYGEIMHYFYAGKQYGVAGPNYDDINWFEPDEPKPTIEHLQSLWPQIEQQVLDKEVYQKRTEPGHGYPPIEELVVALWEKVVEDRPEVANELQAKRIEIKAKYPLNIAGSE